MTAKALSAGQNEMGRGWGGDSFLIHATAPEVIDVRNVAGAAIQIPTSVTSVTFQGSITESGTFGAIYDSDGNAATIDTTGGAGRWYDFPAACFAHGFIRIISAGANANANVVGKS